MVYVSGVFFHVETIMAAVATRRVWVLFGSGFGLPVFGFFGDFWEFGLRFDPGLLD